MATTITVSFQKGGVGKTVTAFHFAHGLPGSVLCVDLDPQANLSELLRVQPSETGAYALFLDSDLADVVQATETARISIAPASVRGFDFDVQLGLENRQQAVDNFRVQLNSYPGDWIVIDCGPGQTTPTIAAQMAADFIVIPYEVSESSVQSFRMLTEFLNEYVAHNIPRLILPTKFDRRQTYQRKILALLQEQFGKFCLPEIPMSVAVSDCWVQHRPAWEFASRNQAAINYKKAIQEVNSYGKKRLSAA